MSLFDPSAVRWDSEDQIQCLSRETKQSKPKSTNLRAHFLCGCFWLTPASHWETSTFLELSGYKRPFFRRSSRRFYKKSFKVLMLRSRDAFQPLSYDLKSGLTTYLVEFQVSHKSRQQTLLRLCGLYVLWPYYQLRLAGKRGTLRSKPGYAVTRKWLF